MNVRVIVRVRNPHRSQTAMAPPCPALRDRRVTIGSVAEYIARNATCSVFILRKPC